MKGFSGTLSATAILTVTGGGGTSGPTEPLVSLAVLPNTQTALVINENVAFFAFGTTASGSTVDLTNKSAVIAGATIRPATWASTIHSVATVDPATGVATAVNSGSTTITATAKNPDGTVVSGSATLTVNISSPGAGEPLVSLAIVPGTQTITGANQSAAFIAIGTTSSGTTVNLTNQTATIGAATIKAAVWNSSSPGVATINSATGSAIAVSNGTTLITAMASNPDGTIVTGTATLNVSFTAASEPLVSLAIVPGTQTATAVNQTAQFIAIGTTSSGATVNLTNQSSTINGANGPVTIKAAVWASSSTAVATIDPATGLAKAIGAGTVAITAVATNTDGTVVTGVSTLTVSTKPEPLVSLSIVPAAQTLTATGQTAQFIAIGTTASGATINLTSAAAKIDASTTQTPMTIQRATWDSSNKQVATVDTAGIATAGGSGVTVITAIATNPDDGTVVTATTTLTVAITPDPEPLLSLAVLPGSQQGLAVGQTAQFYAIGTTSTGTTLDLTSSAGSVGSLSVSAASWSSTDKDVATISATGLVTAKGPGTTAIIAIATNPDKSVVTGTAAYTVTISPSPEPLVSMAIVPASQTISVIGGQPTNLKAMATTGTGTTVDLSGPLSVTIGSLVIKPAVWASSNPGVATVDGSGDVSAVAAGTTAITAIATNPNDGTVVTGTALVTVTASGPSVDGFTSIAIVPGTQAVATPGATVQYKAIGTTTTGGTQDLTSQVAWSVSSANIANIRNTGPDFGLATGIGPGSATVTAVYPSSGVGNLLTGVGTFTVAGGSSQQYTALTITPNTQTLSGALLPAETAQFVALATLGTTGQQVDVTNSPNITWQSSVDNFAIVSPTGLVTAGIYAGSTTITAELKNPADNSVLSATATVTVVVNGVPEPLLSLTIVPGALDVGNLQDTGNFLAIGTFSSAPFTRDLTNDPGTTWISSFPDSFPVSTNGGNSPSGTPTASAGIVTAYGTGIATIIAEYQDPISKTIQTATATFSCILRLPNPNGTPPTPGTCNVGQAGPLKATLTVYGEGLNMDKWLITAPSATDPAGPNTTSPVIHCGPGWAFDGHTGGSVCTGIYPVGSTVILTAPAQSGVAFGGWTYNCTPIQADGTVITQPPYFNADGPNYCRIKLDPTPGSASDGSGAPNATVGAIFNNP